jgi:hypothetical protein
VSTEEPELAGAGVGDTSFPATVSGGAATEDGVAVGERPESTHNKYDSKRSNKTSEVDSETIVIMIHFIISRWCSSLQTRIKFLSIHFIIGGLDFTTSK